MVIQMSNTIWNEWYCTDRFLNKPYPFIDNICKCQIDKPKKKKRNKIYKNNIELRKNDWTGH